MTEPLHYRQEGTGPTIVLIHGDFANGALGWGQLAGELAPAYRVVRVDRRGHGRSPSEPRPYTIAADARDLLTLIDGLGGAPVHLVGHSYGGLVALELVCKAPEQVESLHLLEPPYLSLLPRDPHVAPFMARSARIFAKAAQWDAEETTAAFFRMLGGAQLVQRLRAGEAWPQLVREARAVAHTQFPGTYPAAAARGLTLPAATFVYSGGRSHPGLMRLAQRLAETLGSARLITLPEATHAMQRHPVFSSVLLRALPADGGQGMDPGGRKGSR